MDKVYALGIVAHPDDESFLFAGTSLKLAEEGKKMVVVCATKGEKGADRLGRNLSQQEMSQIRSQELLQACEFLKCGCRFLDHHDGELDRMDFGQLVSELTSLIDSYEPKIVLTFGEEGISGHKDHIVIGKAALAAAKNATHKPQEVWLSSMPSSKIGQFNEHLAKRKVHYSHFDEKHLQGVADDKLLVIDINKYSDQKLTAIKAHASQYLPNLTFDLFLENECFEVIKLP